jgi:two-component system, cell cycle response regulator
VGFDIADERTRAQPIHATWDKRREDVVFLALRGPDSGTRFLVKPPGGIVGREPGAALQSTDPNISRRHALMEFSPDGKVLLTDLGSKNGVFVNGVRISRAELFDGNHVQLSNDSVYRVRFQDPEETELMAALDVSVMRDPVTGLPNRRYVGDRVCQEFSYARRHGEPLAVALIDIDDAKKVVDADGQQGIDTLLKQIAQICRKQVRYEDVVARYGEDEFVVVMRNTTVEHAVAVMERLRKAVGRVTFNTGDIPIRATITIGVAGIAPKAAPKAKAKAQPPVNETASQLLDRADSALFRGKDAGKNRTTQFEG